MKYSYSWLKEYVPNLPESKKLAEILTMRAFEVEDIAAAANDTILDIKVLPNRAFDCLSHIGMAREIAAIINSKFKIQNSKFKEGKFFKTKDLLSIEVQDKKLCLRYSARVVVDVKVGESPQWLKDRLTVCGLRPVNNIVDITNYVMLEFGQPLHAFDLDKLFSVIARSEMTKQSCGDSAGLLLRQSADRNDGIKKIIVRRAKNNEKIITLDEGNSERTLSENILVIADSEKPIAIAGIKGGKGTEIDLKTSRVALEAANFDSINIRKSSKLLNLRTDASVRFENGLSMDLTVEALDRAAAMIAGLAKGKTVAGIADAQSTKPQKISTAVSHSYIESLLGIKISGKKILDIFKRLDLTVKIVKKQKTRNSLRPALRQGLRQGERAQAINIEDVFYEVFAPSRRNDLNTSEDLIEEIGRLYGYEKIPAIMPTSVLMPSIKNEELINEEKARNIMVGAGFAEVYNYSLISEKDKEVFAFGNLAGPEYPLSQDQKYLRPNLAVWLFKNVWENLKYSDQVWLFEIGKIFKLDSKQITEKRMLAGILAEKNIKKSGDLFYQAKGSIDLLLNRLGMDDVWYDDYIETVEFHGSDTRNYAEIFHPLRRAQIKIGDDLIGWVGEAGKNLLGKLEIEEPVVFFEIDFDILNELIEEKIEYKPPSKYPAIVRDLSVLAETNAKIDDVLEIIENMGGPLLEDVDLFDIYEHLSAPYAGLRTGKQEENKSLSFRLVFQSYEKNLTDAEVNKTMEKIIKAIEEKGWEIRK